VQEKAKQMMARNIRKCFLLKSKYKARKNASECEPIVLSIRKEHSCDLDASSIVLWVTPGLLASDHLE
jgi:hypothetical protein